MIMSLCLQIFGQKQKLGQIKILRIKKMLVLLFNTGKIKSPFKLWALNSHLKLRSDDKSDDQHYCSSSLVTAKFHANPSDTDRLTAVYSHVSQIQALERPEKPWHVQKYEKLLSFQYINYLKSILTLLLFIQRKHCDYDPDHCGYMGDLHSALRLNASCVEGGSCCCCCSVNVLLLLSGLHIENDSVRGEAGRRLVWETAGSALR